MGLALRPIWRILIVTSLPPNLHYKLIWASQRLEQKQHVGSPQGLLDLRAR